MMPGVGDAEGLGVAVVESVGDGARVGVSASVGIGVGSVVTGAQALATSRATRSLPIGLPQRAAIFTRPRVPVEEFERVAGWSSKPEGLCRGERCVPFRSIDPAVVELGPAAEALAMPLVHDARHGPWALV